VAKAEKEVKEKWDKDNKPAEEDMGAGMDDEEFDEDEMEEEAEEEEKDEL
jgi:hypothetical protein